MGRNYTDQDIIRVSAEVTSMAQLLKALGLKEAGGNYANMRRNLQRLGLVNAHWTGQGWNKDKQTKDWSKYTRTGRVKHHLIIKRQHMCEICLLSEWQGSIIALELHHKDGDRTHNHEGNLQLLCPNCHAMTDTWRGRNK